MLSLPSNYTSNLGQHIKENYLVIFYDDNDTAAEYVSVYNTTVDSVDYIGAITNIPSIRETIDLENMTSSLSNVSITMANYNNGGFRPEQFLRSESATFLNRQVKIYSQIEDATTLSDCLLVFSGILRAIQTSENSVTVQISAKRPFENINVPTLQSVNGNYAPIVYGDYNPYTYYASILGTDMQNTSVICHPVPVDTVKNGRFYALTHESGGTFNTGYLHESETEIFRTTGSENMSKLGGGLLNNETSSTLTAQDGSTIYARTGQIDLFRAFITKTGLSDGDFDGLTTVSSDKTTISVDRTLTNQGAQVTKYFFISEMGSIKHTPRIIQLSLQFSNVNIDITDFSNYKVLLDVTWGAGTSAHVTNYQAVSRTPANDNIIAISDVNVYFVTDNPPDENTITGDADNTGNMPSSVKVKFEFNSSSSGPNTYDIDFDCEAKFFVSTKILYESDNVQSASDIVNNIKTLYSGQDGHSLGGTLITKPIQAHRHLCETYMPSEFTSTRPAEFTTLNDWLGSRGSLHYYITKQEKIEDCLETLQKFGGFIMRYKNDGTFNYISQAYLTDSTTVSTTNPYLKLVGTLKTTGGSGISASDTSFGIDYGILTETVDNGDILAFYRGPGLYEFVKVYVTDTVITGADIALESVERDLLPSNDTGSVSENANVFKVMFPHDKLTDNDIVNLQLFHLPLDEIVTKYKINYHRDPASTNNFLELSEFENTTYTALYNIASENVKEVKNIIDVKGDLSDFYYRLHGDRTSYPKIKVNFDIINPAFYNVEVGDIIRFDGSSVTQNPFGLPNKGYASTTAWDRLYFMVTSTSRTLGKISVSAYEIY